MADRTLVLVDAGMAAGFRLAKPSLGQLHQALVHLYRQHPEAAVAVLGDPALKWDVPTVEGPMFEGDIIAGAIVCAPAGALEGTAGFLARAAAKARAQGYEVVAFTDRAIPDVSLGRLRNDGGRWLWDLDATRTLDADQVGPPCLESPAPPGPLIVRRAFMVLAALVCVVALAGPAGGQETTTSSTAPAVPSQDIIPRPNSGSAPQEAGDRGGALQLGLLALLVVAIGGAVLVLVRQSRRTRAGG